MSFLNKKGVLFTYFLGVYRKSAFFKIPRGRPPFFSLFWYPPLKVHFFDVLDHFFSQYAVPVPNLTGNYPCFPEISRKSHFFSDLTKTGKFDVLDPFWTPPETPTFFALLPVLGPKQPGFGHFSYLLDSRFRAFFYPQTGKPQKSSVLWVFPYKILFSGTYYGTPNFGCFGPL